MGGGPAVGLDAFGRLAEPPDADRRSAGAPYDDQFAFLDSLTRMTPVQVGEVADTLRPVEVGPQASLHAPKVRSDGAPPAEIEARLAGMLSI